MSDEEIAAFLSATSLMVFGSQGPQGYPHLVTVGFLQHEGRIVFNGYRRSQKVVNVGRNPKVTCLFEDPGHAYQDVRGVLINGTARIIDDDDVVAWSYEAISRRLGNWDHGAAHGLHAGVAKRVVIEVEAVRVTSWNFGLLSRDND